MTSLITSLNAFALKLAGAVHESGRNRILFPSSVAPVAAMLLAGATGATQREFERVLGIGKDQAREIPRVLREIEASFAAGGEFEFLTRSSVWTGIQFPLLESYTGKMAREFFAEVDTLDFAVAVDAAATINAWADRETLGRIPAVVDPSMFDDTVALVAANATAYTGAWRFPFDPSATYKTPFTTSDGTTINVLSMHHELRLPYWEHPSYDAVAVPYKGNATMLFVLPALGIKLDEFLYSGVSNVLGDLTSHLRHGKVVLRVPKVKAEDRIDLITPLTTMGLTTPWGSEAEFEDLVSLDENQFFMVSDFFQKSTAEWDEHESKGAAVTVGIGRVRTTSLPAPEPVKYFIIDRPFLAILVDDATGLFIGSFAIEAPVQ